MPKKLSEPKAAEYIGVSHQVLQKMRYKGKTGPKYYKINNRAYYDPSDLDAYIKSVAHTPKGEEK
jgi:hypothetical protein